MGKVIIHEDKLNEAKTAAKALEQSIDQTYETCKQLLSYVNKAEWNGKARDSFLTYLEIIEKYHQEMKGAVKKQTKALNNLDGYLDDFLKDSSVKEVKNL
jgi:hypothetical protein